MSSVQAGVSVHIQGAATQAVWPGTGAPGGVCAASLTRTRRSASYAGSCECTGGLRVPSIETESAGLWRALLLT